LFTIFIAAALFPGLLSTWLAILLAEFLPSSLGGSNQKFAPCYRKIKEMAYSAPEMDIMKKCNVSARRKMFFDGCVTRAIFIPVEYFFSIQALPVLIGSDPTIKTLQA
jgi:hypothetical protein